jgi:hypothetical protein
MLVWVLAATPACFGSDKVCDLLAADVTNAQINLLSVLNEHDSDRDNQVHEGRAAERLLYIAATCPKQFLAEEETSESKKWMGNWKTALRDDPTLQPKERDTLIAAAKAGVLRDEVYGKRISSLLNEVSAAPAQPLLSQCGSTFRHLLIGQLDDWMARSGSLWFSYSDTMLFMVASCTEDSYYVLDQRPEVLSSWLRELPTASFWGDPSGTKKLQAKQKSLVELLLEEQPPEYLRATRNQLLVRIRDLCVRAIDEPTPCEATVEQKH